MGDYGPGSAVSADRMSTWSITTTSGPPLVTIPGRYTVPSMETTPESRFGALVAVASDQYVFRSTQNRRFKACRTCRQQKARCQGSDNPPCRRCEATGRDCIFDRIGSRKRRRLSRDEDDDLEEPQVAQPSPSMTSKERQAGHSGVQNQDYGHHDSQQSTSRREHNRGQYIDPNANREALRTTGRSNFADPTTIPRPDNATTNRRPSFVHPAARDNIESPETLDLGRLNAPISAVHALQPACAGAAVSSSSPYSAVSPGGVSSSTTALTSRNRTEGGLPPHHEDVVSTGLMTSARARELFNAYMAGANVFLPLFDPLTDNFEAMQQRSAFCLNAILAVASRVFTEPSLASVNLADQCLREAKAQAARTLFLSSPTLEDIQGMLVLAAYSEQYWFAASHARTMAEDLQLRACLPQLIGDKQPFPTVSRKQLVRAARAALILHNVEREVASGTGRRSTTDDIDKRSLLLFLQARESFDSDVRIASTIDVTQLRGRLLDELDGLEILPGIVSQTLQKFSRAIDDWFADWDQVYEENEFHVTSFHRTSLRLQKDYAMIILASAMIRRLVSNLHRQQGLEIAIDGETKTLVDHTIQVSTGLLTMIARSDSYKWHLRWAPSYSSQFAVFAAALVNRLSILSPHIIKWSELLPSILTISEAIDTANPTCAALLQDLASTVRTRIFPNGKMPQEPQASATSDSSSAGLARSFTAHDVQPTTLNLPGTTLAQVDSVPDGVFQTRATVEMGQTPSSVAIISPAASSYPTQGPNGHRSHDTAQTFIDAQSTYPRPDARSAPVDFMFDYQSFAASVSAYERGQANAFDFSWGFNQQPDGEL